MYTTTRVVEVVRGTPPPGSPLWRAITGRRRTPAFAANSAAPIPKMNSRPRSPSGKALLRFARRDQAFPGGPGVGSQEPGGTGAQRHEGTDRAGGAPRMADLASQADQADVHLHSEPGGHGLLHDLMSSDSAGPLAVEPEPPGHPVHMGVDREGR